MITFFIGSVQKVLLGIRHARVKYMYTICHVLLGALPDVADAVGDVDLNSLSTLLNNHLIILQSADGSALVVYQIIAN